MSDMPTLEDHEKAVRSLGEAFHSWVLSQMKGRSWTHATLEVRYASDGSHWNDKMRVQTPDGAAISLGSTNEIRLGLVRMSRLRHALGWYALKLDITSDGEATVNYDYNSNCIDDPSFFAD